MFFCRGKGSNFHLIKVFITLVLTLFFPFLTYFFNSFSGGTTSTHVVSLSLIQLHFIKFKSYKDMVSPFFSGAIL